MLTKYLPALSSGYLRPLKFRSTSLYLPTSYKGSCFCELIMHLHCACRIAGLTLYATDLGSSLPLSAIHSRLTLWDLVRPSVTFVNLDLTTIDKIVTFSLTKAENLL